MRRILPVLLTCLLFAIPMFAQRGGHAGGGMRSGVRSGGVSRGGFSGFRGGFNQQRFFRGNFGFHRFPRTFIYPAFYGGFGYSEPFNNSYPNYASYPSGGYSYSSNPTPVIITQNYYSAPPVEYAPEARVEEYRPQPPATEERKDESSLYLIAFKDHTIRAVLAYWADGATLHYVTMDHEQKQTTVASVDRDLSERLNRERNVAFRLPR